jgi:hypothetical protein
VAQARLRSLALEELRGEWRRRYHGEPPQISRDLLVLGLGYRLQEIDYGAPITRLQQPRHLTHKAFRLRHWREARSHEPA